MMTEKRFRLNDGINNFTDTVNGKQYSEHNLDEIVELLNELDSENTELKKVLQYETQMHNKWKTECTNEIKENNKIKNTIKEMYETERTQLGQSVLKQLLEAIQ